MYILMFKNNIYKIYLTLSFLSLFVLINCGGAGTSGVSGANSGGNSLSTDGPLTYSTIKQYSSGSGVVIAHGKALPSSQKDSNFVVIHESLGAVQDVLSGQTNLIVVAEQTSGNYYVVERSGVSSNGQVIGVLSAGYNLNSSGTEYVSLSGVTIDGSLGFFSAGTEVVNMPTGFFIYQGEASIVRLSPIVNGEDGTMTMLADFNSNTASIAANTPSYTFYHNNIVINNSDGSLTGNSGSIGELGGQVESANITGYFAGTNAEAVHGLSYSSGDNENYIGAFAATKNDY